MNSRLPQNPNLTLHTQQVFNGYSVYLQRGPLIKDYLDSIDRTIQSALSEHPRTFAIRVDLRLPSQFEHNGSNVISRFMESLKAQIRADLKRKARIGTRAHHSTLRYVWVKEQDTALQCHYHVVLLLNNDTYHTLGDFIAPEGNMAARIKKAWARALGLNLFASAGLVYFPDNPVYHINANSNKYVQELDALFYRVSYFAKAETKNFGDRSNTFRCSQK